MATTKHKGRLTKKKVERIVLFTSFVVLELAVIAYWLWFINGQYYKDEVIITSGSIFTVIFNIPLARWLIIYKYKLIDRTANWWNSLPENGE